MFAPRGCVRLKSSSCSVAAVCACCNVIFVLRVVCLEQLQLLRDLPYMVHASYTLPIILLSFGASHHVQDLTVSFPEGLSTSPQASNHAGCTSM